ncbi:hypothetical protein ABKN59_010697 [Abortiporus biennis]
MRLPPLWFSCSPSPFTISEHSPTKPMSSSSSQRRAYKRLPRLRRSSRRVETSDEDTTISSTDEAIDTSRLPDNRQHEFTPLPDGSNNGHDDETTLNAESLDQVSALPKFPDTRQRKILDRPIGPQELSVGSKSSQSGAKSTRSKKPVTPNPNDKVRANLAKQAQSTPSQKNMRESSQSADGRFLDSAVKGYIKGHFSSVVHREYPILDFVRFAWDFTPEDIPAGDYDIPMEYVKGYCLAKKDDNQHGERASCIWLSKILDHLHDALPDNPSNGAQFINVRDRLVIGNFAKLKPDFSRSEKEDIDDEEHWEDMTSFAEVKHRRPLDLPASQDEPTLRIDLSSLLNKEPEEVDSDEETEEVDEEPEVYEEPASPTTPVKRKRVNTPLPSSTESSKRRKNEDGSAGAPAIKPKRRATTSLTEHENVNSVEEFKKVFRDVVIAHHWVFTVAKILHRDLSATNLMVQRIGKEINGILADFDLAVGESKEAQDEEIRRLRGLDSDSTPPSQRPGRVTSMEINPVREKAQIDKKCQKMRYRTGTGPFMAIEVLKLTPTPIHVYRYDLESFFYVLVWFCAGFNPKKNTLSSIDDWRTPSFVQIAKKQKSIHQTSNQLRHRLCQHASNIRARVKDISDRKAKLRILKDDAFLSSREKREQRRNLNRSIEESVLEVESLKDKRKKLATFENFMAKLKVDISPPPPSASTETEESDDDYDKFADLDEDSLGND